MLYGHFIDFPGTDARVVPVNVVQLLHHEVDLWMLGENFIQEFRGIVEGNAELTELSLCPFLFQEFKGIPFLTVLICLTADAVDQIEIKVIHMTFFQLLLEDCLHVLFLLHKLDGHLCGKQEGIPRIPVNETSAQRGL